MENERALVGALIFILLIVGANFVMFLIARSWAKGGDSRWMSALRDSLSKPLEGSSNNSMDELRSKMKELEGDRKEEK
ncbi:MAG TPA: hypothetical protein VIS72_01455 [Anaerolineales bacterium]